ncbi:MAG: hypothetical protein ACD_76C00164G0001 [uncultured bacterium]|nr:MAG: hypothetical protein ACD_76C00164G0001 [uncultured bacterium]HBD05000.1 peptide chain release factor N(5)-glutamine methyltransferase [Candidatus Uhrbacteria bacterium]
MIQYVYMDIKTVLVRAVQDLKSHEDSDELTGSRIDSPALDAEVLLAHALGKDTGYLLSHSADAAPEKSLANFLKYIERRKNHEPVAYITGKKAFYGRDFIVSPSVLIPRPETELIIDESLARAQGNTLFMDVGTGSGAIAVTLAAESKKNIIAIDISNKALRVAHENATLHNVAGKIELKQGNVLEPILNESLNNYDCAIIAANLPYLTSRQYSKTQQEVQLFEPREALDGGNDGLDHYWKLFRQLQNNRNIFPNELYIIFEIDPAQTELIEPMISKTLPNAVFEIKKDLSGKDRVVVVRG